MNNKNNKDNNLSNKSSLIKVALLGFGTIGSGVYTLLENQSKLISERLYSATGRNISLEIAKVLVLPDEYPEQLPQEIRVTDYDQILNDDSIEIVVELMGGLEPATKFMNQAMERGKHVVTANKYAIFTAQGALEEKADLTDVHLRYEAAVAGAIPILRSITEGLIGDEVEEVVGILNGSTNYILTEVKKGKSLEQALEEARQNGYLEADPSADLEGYDAMHKLGILGYLITGNYPAEREIERAGITGISPQDIEQAKQNDQAIKLVARATKTETGKFTYSVRPEALAEDHPLFHTEGVLNTIQIKCKYAQELAFTGYGAGSLETATAVTGDIVSIARDLHIC